MSPSAQVHSSLSWTTRARLSERGETSLRGIKTNLRLRLLPQGRDCSQYR